LRNDLNKRLDEIEKHLSAIDDRVNKLSNRISAIDDIEICLTSIDEQVSDLTQRVQAVKLKCTSTNDTTEEIAVVRQDINKARRAINDNEQYIVEEITSASKAYQFWMETVNKQWSTSYEVNYT